MTEVLTNPHEIPKETLPARETLFDVLSILDENARYALYPKLEARGDLGYFSVSCIRIICSNMNAIKKLMPGFTPESLAIFRNTQEAVVDFFWIISLVKHGTGYQALVESFRNYPFAAFKKAKPLIENMRERDPFIKNLTEDEYHDLTFEPDGKDVPDPAKSWRHVEGISKREREWSNRCSIAAKCAEELVGLRCAPYHENLIATSGFAHFDPTQMIYHKKPFPSVLYDRLFNMGLGMLFDVMMVAYREIIKLEPPELFQVQGKRFLWLKQ